MQIPPRHRIVLAALPFLAVGAMALDSASAHACLVTAEAPLPPSSDTPSPLADASKRITTPLLGLKLDAFEVGPEVVVDRTLQLMWAVRLDPSNRKARYAAAVGLFGPSPLYDCEDAVRDRWQDEALKGLWAATQAGDKDALAALTDVVHAESHSMAAGGGVTYTAPQWAELTKGPAGPVADAAREVLDWLHADADARAAAPAHIPAAGSIKLDKKSVRGLDGLKKVWLEGGDETEPMRGAFDWRRPPLWTCDAKCCTAPFFTRGPNSAQVTSLCFDAKGTLTSIKTDADTEPP